MRNKEVAKKLYELASLAELAGENPFKVNAYIEAARRIENLPIPIEELAKEGRLTEIKGVGSGIAKKIIQFLETGTIEKLEEFKKKVPPSLLELEKIPGIGPKGALSLYKHLGIKTIEELKEAAEKGKIRTLPGFGPKKEENILKALQGMKKKEEKRVSIGLALPLAEFIRDEIKRNAPVDKIMVCGSIRRMKETIGDIDILVTSRDGEKVMEVFTNLPVVKEVLVMGDTKTSVITKEDIQVDVRVVEPESFGAAIQYFTGSREHNVKLRELAIKKGLKINEYGVFRGGKRIGGEKEEDVYSALGLPLIPPEMREDRGEIEEGLRGKLPKIIDYKDIKGDTHVHTNYSDGVDSIEKMAEAAMDMGYEYIVISDHAKSLGVASGMDLDEFKREKREIERLNEKFAPKFRIFFSVELNILSDGSVDFPEEELNIFDFCIIGIHSGFNQDREKMTERIKRAMGIKKVKILAHPTGRIIGEREGYRVDIEEIFKEAKESGVFLEINATPQRLDLSDINVMHAKSLYGLKFTIGTDAHAKVSLRDMRFGVGVARRGWLTKEDVINTLPVEEFEKVMMDK